VLDRKDAIPSDLVPALPELEGLKHELAIPFPLPAVDAYLREVCVTLTRAISRRETRLGYRRVALTLGSIEYSLTLSAATPDQSFDRLSVVDIYARALDHSRTYLSIEPASVLQPSADAAAQAAFITLVQSIAGFFSTMTEQLYEEQAQFERLLSQQRANADDQHSYPATPRSDLATAARQLGGLLGAMPRKIGSHQSWPEDDWAWEEVNTKKRPRAEVRAEWEQRLSPERKLKDPKDSFRHAVLSGRKGGRKAER
jgi:hypothetical protein